MATLVDARLDYEEALKLGKKEGGTPLVLDSLLKEKNILHPTEVSLGVVDIPMERIVGTKTEGRKNTFSKSFYPLLEEGSEFAGKWMNLCQIHLEEGIRDPIKAYEFMNEFYIEEGNKRVSVLRYFNAVSISAKVTRIIPPQSDDPETQIYYEFMDFYSLSKINDIWFSKVGSFPKFQRLVGKQPNESWTQDEQRKFHSIYARFLKEFHALKAKNSTTLPGDAFLYFIDLYDYNTMSDFSYTEMKEKVIKLRDEFLLLNTSQPVSLQMEPDEKAAHAKKNLLLRLIPQGSKPLKVCFIHANNKNNSSWTYAHELGRTQLQEAFPDQVSTTSYQDITEETIADTLEKAVEEENELIFTTSPVFEKDTLKAAIEHPGVKFLNCSPNTSHKNMRTYYARMHEAKFLMGAIAGALTDNNRIGYIADYPIYGTIACINAFALGAKMVNPKATVYLDWSKKINADTHTWFTENEISIISGHDMPPASAYDPYFGLYQINKDSSVWNIAMPIWNWGRFYEQMIRNVMNGSWKLDEEKDATKGRNYWWGMSSGLIHMICSQRLPIGTARLISLLKQSICSEGFHVFSGILYSQDGIVQKDPDGVLSAEEILTMDWLAENIVGSIPAKQELNETAQQLSETVGISLEDITT